MEHHNVTGNYHNCPPVLNHNAEILFCACGSSIKQISSKTGDLLSSFSEHCNAVSCIVLDRKHGTNGMVYSTSLDGVLIYWNSKTRVVRKTWSLNAPIYNLLVPISKPNELYVVQGKFLQAPSADEKVQEKSSASTDLVLQSNQHVVSCGANLQSVLGKEQYKVSAFDLTLGRISRRVARVFLPHRTACLTMLNNAEYLLTVNKRKLFLWDVMSNSFVGYRALSELPHSITCIAASTVATEAGAGASPLEYSSYYGRSSSTKQVVVTGHDNGAILVWHDLAQWVARQPIVTFSYDAETQRKVKSVTQPSVASTEAGQQGAPVCTTLHWHAHNIYALSLSSDCRQLYSGGEEGVLVCWQLEGSSKHFLPRLGASIADIVSNSTDARIAVTTTDNCIRLVNVSAMKDEWVLRSMHLGSYCNVKSGASTTSGKGKGHYLMHNPYEPLLSERNTYRSQLVVEPRSNYLVGNGIPNLLQFYDVGMGIYRSALEVMQYSRVSKTEKHTKLFVPTVTMYCFGKYGKVRAVKNGKGVSVVTDIEYYLATVDVLRGEEMTAETSLKIWKFDVNSATYKLSVQIDRPFEGHKVTSLSFVPDSSGGFTGLATGGANGCVKMWYLREGSWKCMYSFAYKDAAVRALCFSSDGSLLCVTHTNLVSFWDPVSLSCRGTLVVPTPNSITFCKFIEPCFEADHGSGSGESYLVLGTGRSVTVIDCLSMKIAWNLQSTGIDCIAVASNDVEAVCIPGANRPVVGHGRAQMGWIAVVHSGSETSTGPQHSNIRLYDPSSSTPVHCGAPLNTSVVSLTFYTDNFGDSCTGGTEAAGAVHLRHGLLFVTAAGELCALGELSVAQEHEDAGAVTVTLARTADRHAPQVFIEDGSVLSASEQAVRSVERKAGVGAVGPWYAATVPTGAVVGGSTSLISSIYESFVSGLLKQSGPVIAEVESLSGGSPQPGISLEAIEKSLFGSLNSPNGVADSAASGGTMSSADETELDMDSHSKRMRVDKAPVVMASLTSKDVGILRSQHEHCIQSMSDIFASSSSAKVNSISSKKRK